MPELLVEHRGSSLFPRVTFVPELMLQVSPRWEVWASHVKLAPGAFVIRDNKLGLTKAFGTFSWEPDVVLGHFYLFFSACCWS